MIDDHMGSCTAVYGLSRDDIGFHRDYIELMRHHIGLHRDILPPTMKNQMGKKIGHEMETCT